MRRKAFTLIELVVSIAVLAVIVTISGTVFQVTIDTYRQASAQNEIMRKFRAITEQIDEDFNGFIKDAPAAAIFHSTSGEPDAIRSDRMVFFSAGDFQTTRQFRYNGNKYKTVHGNVARIYYGQSAEPVPSTTNLEEIRNVILVRRMQISTVDDTLGYVDANDPNLPVEYSKRPLAVWNLNRPPSNPSGVSAWIGRPNAKFDPAGPETKEDVIPMLMAEGVHDFRIQALSSINDKGELVWWPSNFQVNQKEDYRTGSPTAFKFTFTIYDSKGIFKDGKTFTHIVYLAD